MARRWQIIRVELVSGRGQVFMPPPGRELVLPPSTTFVQLGLAIDRALARWDLAHLREFVLSDGTRVVDDLVQAADASGFVGPLLDKLLEQTEKVKAHVSVGDVFRYVFDFGDDWICRCTVTGLGDPEQLDGIVTDAPAVFWGWGSLPDQYGRSRPDDDGVAEDEQPDADQRGREEQEVHRFVTEFGHGKPDFVDLGQLRAADAAGDPRAVLDELIAVDVEPALQQVGQALAHIWDTGVRASSSTGRQRSRIRNDLMALTLALVGRLNTRGGPGDDPLSKELLARARGEVPEGDPLPVDLEVISEVMASYGEIDGGYLDLDTGQALPADLIDQYGVGASSLEEEGIEELGVEPGHRWVRIDGGGWKEHGAQRRAFIDYLDSPGIGRAAKAEAAGALRQALEQRGGDRRFHDALGELGLVDQWLAFRDDRRWGLARALLASHGLRAARLPRS